VGDFDASTVDCRINEDK